MNNNPSTSYPPSTFVQQPIYSHHDQFYHDLYKKSPYELVEVITSLTDECIAFASTMYVTTFEDICAKFDEFNTKMYHFNKKINIALDFIVLKEKNETKRLQYDKCLNCICGESIFYDPGNYVDMWKGLIDRQHDYVEFQKIIQDINIEEKEKTLQEYEKSYHANTMITKDAYILKHNNKVNWIIANMYRIKLSLERDNSSDDMFHI